MSTGESYMKKKDLEHSVVHINFYVKNICIWIKVQFQFFHLLSNFDQNLLMSMWLNFFLHEMGEEIMIKSS